MVTKTLHTDKHTNIRHWRNLYKIIALRQGTVRRPKGFVGTIWESFGTILSHLEQFGSHLGLFNLSQHLGN